MAGAAAWRRRAADAEVDGRAQRLRVREGARSRGRPLGREPEERALAIAGAAAIAQTGIPGGQQAVTWIIFIVIASIGVATPVVPSLALGGRSRDLLDHLRGWMAYNNAVIMAVLMLVIGAKLIGDAISGFSA